MTNYLHSDEVVLYEGAVTSKNYKGALLLTLTSQKLLILEREKGIFKKKRELVEIIALDSVKIFNDVAQIKHKGDMVEIQTITANITLTLSGMLEARKFASTMVDAITGTTLAQRSSEKIKGVLGMVDDTLGIDTRGTIKGILENGVKSAILNGIGKKK